MGQWNIEIGNDLEMPTGEVGRVEGVLRLSDKISHATIAGVSVQNTFEQIRRLVPTAVRLAV